MADEGVVQDNELEKIRQANAELQAKVEKQQTEIEQREARLQVFREQQVAQEFTPAKPPELQYPQNDTGQYQVNGDEDPNAQLVQAFQALQSDFQGMKNENGLDRFKRENPEAAKDMDAILKRIADPMEKAKHIHYGVNGQPDYYLTLNSSNQAVQIERYREAEAKAKQVAVEQKPNRDLNRAQATISGDGSVSEGETVDVSKMTSDQMLAAGLVEQDPDDLIRPLG